MLASKAIAASAENRRSKLLRQTWSAIIDLKGPTASTLDRLDELSVCIAARGHAVPKAADPERPPGIGSAAVARELARRAKSCFRSTAMPTRELEKLIVLRRLADDGNPVNPLDGCQRRRRPGPAGNLKPAKGKSTERIDGIVATIMRSPAP